MTNKENTELRLGYIPANKLMDLFKHSNLSICAEIEEHIHGENVITDFNIMESDCTEQDVQELINDGYEFFID